MSAYAAIFTPTLCVCAHWATNNEKDLERSAPNMTSLVQGYRGGYTKDERRKIEGRLFANKVQYGGCLGAII